MGFRMNRDHLIHIIVQHLTQGDYDTGIKTFVKDYCDLNDITMPSDIEIFDASIIADKLIKNEVRSGIK